MRTPTSAWLRACWHFVRRQQTLAVAPESEAGESSLDTAFRAAEYRVHMDARRVTVRIGQRCPPLLTDWLSKYGYRRGWIMTAHNPYGRLDSPAQNRRRAAALERRVSTLTAYRLHTCGIDPGGNWPDEPGLLLAGLPAATVRRLGVQFGQAAIVAVERSRRPRLLWLGSQT